MKKLLFLFAAIMTAMTVWVFTACSSDGMERVSERRSGFYSASDSAFTVTAVSGVRETPYEADGTVGELKPYTLITLLPVAFDINAVYTYSAKIGDTLFGGTLIVHPFAASFSAEVEVEASAPFTVSVACGGTKTELELVSLVTEDMLTFDRAVDVAKTELKPQGEYEIRVRIIKNPISQDGICWHVAFCNESGKSGVLLDPMTAKIIAVKT